MTMTGPAATPEPGRDVRLLSAQLDVLAGIVAGVPLGKALDALLAVVESVSCHGMLGSVLLLDDEGLHLRHCAAPSLPVSYTEAIDGVAIGPSVGSCGTAAHRRQQVVVEDIARDPLWADFRALAESAGLRACWSTPIFGADGRLLGTFAMYYPEPQAPTTEDLALAEVLVRTVAMAIERSRADEERERELAAERAAATTLQHSLLPAVPSRIGPVRLAARYRTGDPGVEVGGDWYDAVPVRDGLVVVVGDVQGHDLGAAALMGQLRTVARTYATMGHPPAMVLAGMDSYLSQLDSDRLVTALVVQLDAEARSVVTASAGHPPCLVLAPDVTGRLAVGHVALEVGPPLGIGQLWPERTSVLPPEAVLLAYTDGLVESRSWSLDHGLTLLHDVLAALPRAASLDRVLDAVLGLVPTGSRGDDVAVLALSTPAGSAVDRPASYRWMPPQSSSVPLARAWVEGLLRGWGVPMAGVHNAALVLSEMATNACRQSQEPFRLHLAVEREPREIVVEVFDHSDRLPRLATSDATRTEGRGLQVVDQLSVGWGVREEHDGKSVWARLSIG